MSAFRQQPPERAWFHVVLPLWWQHWLSLLSVNVVALLLCLSIILLPAGLLLPFLAARELAASGSLQVRVLWRELVPRLPAALVFTTVNAAAVFLFRFATGSYVTIGVLWPVPFLYAAAFIWWCLQLQVLTVLAGGEARRGVPALLKSAFRLLFRRPAGSLALGAGALLLSAAALRLPVLLLSGVLQLIPLGAMLRGHEDHLLTPEPVTDIPSMK